jgi:hypothetical protein
VPSFELEVEEPEVVEVGKVLSSKNSKIFINDFGRMVGALPGFVLMIEGFELGPLFGLPVECINGVDTFLSLASTSKENKSIVFAIITERGIGPGFGDVSRGIVVLPFESQGAKSPEVIHVVVVYDEKRSTCIAAKDDEIGSDDTTAVAPAFSGFVSVEGLNLVPVEFCHWLGSGKVLIIYFFTIKETPGYII